MASAGEPTSCFFVAHLGNLGPAVVERLERWAVASCVEHAMRRHEDGSVALYVVKKSARTARQYQSLLRTLTSHWKMNFGKLDRGWMSLLIDAEYRSAVGGATERAECTATDCEVARPQAIAGPPVLAPELAELGIGCVQRVSLSKGFDERARALLDRLRATRKALQPRSAVCAA